MLTLTLPELHVQKLIRQVAAIAANRRARRELATMTDLALADIGLTRGAIAQAVMLPSADGIDPVRGGRSLR